MYWREAREEMREGGRVYISINSRLNNVLFGVSHNPQDHLNISWTKNGNQPPRLNNSFLGGESVSNDLRNCLKKHQEKVTEVHLEVS